MGRTGFRGPLRALPALRALPVLRAIPALAIGLGLLAGCVAAPAGFQDLGNGLGEGLGGGSGDGPSGGDLLGPASGTGGKSGAGAKTGSTSKAGGATINGGESALGEALSSQSFGDSEFGVQFVKGRKVQAITGVSFEVRCMYTEAVVRSNADLADYHVGLKALPNSLTGYALNVPLPGSVAGAGAPRLRYAQHTANDDPLFPDLLDGTRTINPTTESTVYFMGQGILKTEHNGSSPPSVSDAFSTFVSSTPVGSVADLQGAKLSFANSEALFNSLWMTGVTYTASGSIPLAAAVTDRPLTDNTTLTNSRYYKWKFPFSATAFTLGTALPLGRLIFDLRVLDANGGVTAWGATQFLLQPGANALVVTINENSQGLGKVDFTLPK